MATQFKISKVEEISAEIEASKAVYFTDYLGLSVEEINDLRSKLFKENVKMQVVKNTLIKRSVENAGFDYNLDDILVGSTALVYSDSDPVAPAKILLDTKKKLKDLGKPDVKAILFEGELFGTEKVNEIAALPTKEVLLGKFLGALSYPMQTMVGLLQSPMRDLLGVLKSLKENKK